MMIRRSNQESLTGGLQESGRDIFREEVDRIGGNLDNHPDFYGKPATAIQTIVEGTRMLMRGGNLTTSLIVTPVHSVELYSQRTGDPNLNALKDQERIDYLSKRRQELLGHEVGSAAMAMLFDPVLFRVDYNELLLRKGELGVESVSTLGGKPNIRTLRRAVRFAEVASTLIQEEETEATLGRYQLPTNFVVTTGVLHEPETPIDGRESDEWLAAQADAMSSGLEIANSLTWPKNTFIGDTGAIHQRRVVDRYSSALERVQYVINQRGG